MRKRPLARHSLHVACQCSPARRKARARSPCHCHATHPTRHPLPWHRLASYAADVFEEEPLSADAKLLRCESFLGTPHIGGATAEAQARVGLQLAHAVVAVLGGSEQRPADGIVCEPSHYS